jgi:nucleotide-binding universal stress UspA family protein
MYETILVPTDGSPGARRAFAHAVQLAERADAAVHVLSVATPSTRDSAGGDRDRLADERIETTTDEVATTAVEVTTAVRSGVPHEELLTYADEVDCGLVVMGTHGRTGVRRYVLGSVTEKVVRLSEVPVLTVRSGEDARVQFPYDDILVPTDGTEGASVAVEPALGLATLCEARLHAVSVVDTRAVGTTVRPDIVLGELKSQAHEAVDEVARRASKAGVEHIRTAVEEGTPYRALLSYVDEFAVDLVVMGTHGRRGVDRYLLGSVTEKLVRTSRAPVMSIRYPSV